MNKSILMLLAAVVLCTSAVSAQPVPRNDGAPYMGIMQRTIQVTGDAEVEVALDEVCVVVELCGYAQPGNDGKTVAIEDAEKEFYKQLEALGISRDAVVECNVTGDRPFRKFDGRARRDFKFADRKERFDRQRPGRPLPDSMRRNGDRPGRPDIAPRRFCQGMKRYEITLNDFSLVDKIRKNVDGRAMVRMEVAEMSCSKIDEYIKQARVDALSNAKASATALAEAAGAKLGDVMNIVVAPSHGKRGDIDRRNGVIKLRSTVAVTFAIK